jgi:diadenosine tetraphosphate (Ap4A) HIT family hydrolase
MVDAASVAARARAAAGPDGRLPLPDLIGWDTFPFEGDLLVKRLDEPVLPEPPRHGEDGAANCAMCTKGDDGYVWVSDRWRLTVPIAPMPVPALLLEPRAHVDLADLDDAMAAELGLLAVRLARAMEAEPGVGRAHVDRIGDGMAHLHVWFLARPAGLLQLRGSCLMDWLDVLPPMPADELDAFARRVAAAL